MPGFDLERLGEEITGLAAHIHAVTREKVQVAHALEAADVSAETWGPSGILQVTIQEIQYGVKQVLAGFFAADSMLAPRVGHHLERYHLVLQRLE
jgi:hypothetical protein